MMTGNATPAQIAGLLMALRVRGETVEEITAGAMALRERMTRIEAPPGAIDTCGTGGDDSGTYNISTAARPGRGRLRRSGGQARQPRPVVAARARRTCCRRWASTSTASWR